MSNRTRQPITPGPSTHSVARKGRSWYGRSIDVSGAWPEPQVPIYICEACGNEIVDGDHISVQIGKNNAVYFHKSCYIDPDNQSMIRSLVVAEDVMGI